MSLPNFLGIGVQKAGTTLLYQLLKQHPQIYLPDSKELHFFDRDEEYQKGVSWYQNNYFGGAENYPWIGEITPSYIFFESAPERIFKTLGPNIKLIIILRNPVDRAYSHYWMQYKRGIETFPFIEALLMELARIRQGYFGKTRFSYLTRGFYTEQIKRYLNYFPLENMKFFLFEEFILDIPGIVSEVLDFLNCDHNYLNELKVFDKVNSSELNRKQYLQGVLLNRKYVSKNGLLGFKPDYPPLKSKYRKMVGQIYKEDIEGLQSLINKDFSIWWSSIFE